MSAGCIRGSASALEITSAAHRLSLDHPQAALLDAFVSRQQRSGRDSAARAAWLVQVQELAQDEAECEAAWAACAAQAATVECCSEEADRTEASLQAALEAADGCLEEALVAAAAADNLLGKGRPSPPTHSASPAAVQQWLQAAQERLSQAMAAVNAALQQQRLPRASSSGVRCSESGLSSTTLAEQVRSLLDVHSLAAPLCKARLLQQAEQAEAWHAEERQRCTAALHAFQICPKSRASRRQRRSQEPGQLLTAVNSCAFTEDGWSAGEQAVFVHACRACLAPGGGGQAALERRLEAALPWRSSQAVRAHERWHGEASRLQAALQRVEASWQQERAALLGAAAGLVREAEAAVMAGAEAALAQLQAAAACLQSSYRLEEAQAAQEERTAAESFSNAAAAAEAATKRFEEWQAQQDHDARLKQLIAQHRQRQAQAAAAAATAEQESVAQRRREAAAAAAEGSLRVAHRAEQTAAKLAAQKEAQAARQAAQARREAALSALHLRVAPAAQRDAARATGPTQSSAAALSSGRAQHGLLAGVMAGLTSKQVLQDQRFRVRAGSGCIKFPAHCWHAAAARVALFPGSRMPD